MNPPKWLYILLIWVCWMWGKRVVRWIVFSVLLFMYMYTIVKVGRWLLVWLISLNPEYLLLFSLSVIAVCMGSILAGFWGSN